MKDANILILDYKEDFVRWLDTDLAEVEETTQKDTCRKIKITYPYENEHIDENTKLWYQQGNKIYIPSINGITSCLYVINTEYEIDFWEKNTVTVEAEEVLTELNYDFVSFPSGQVINVTEGQLDTWFGMFYDITGLDALSTNRKQVAPEGIMSRMSLLRLIEEETGRVFVTTYEQEDNTIYRSLYLANVDSLRYVAQTETLDLNFNLESLEFTKSEEDTYNAMCPVFTGSSSIIDMADLTNNLDNISSAIVNKAEQRTENANNLRLNQSIMSINTQLLEAGVLEGEPTVIGNIAVDGDDLLEKWLEYEVSEGQEVPMIITQDEEGNTVTTAHWNAPFEKEAGELYIKYIGVNQTDYNIINPYNPAKAPTMMKCGKQSTNETLVEAIYNELATTLLNKMQPRYELRIQVKDIQDMLGVNHLGYQLHESLQVRVPNFNYYIPCRITQTVKNLHYPGENTIKIETEVVSIFDLIPTQINSESRIIGSNEASNTIFGGTLTTTENEPLEDKYVVMDIKLTKAYTTETQEVKEQEVKKFDPVNNTYVFSDIQIQNLEKQIRNERIKTGGYGGTFYIRDVEGVVYSLDDNYAAPLVFTRNSIYTMNEEFYGGDDPQKKLGKGFFDDTVEVHLYENPKELFNSTNIFKESKKYYYAIMYEHYKRKDPLLSKLSGYAVSSELQNGPTCLPASMANATAAVMNYHTEYELSKLMGTSNQGTNRVKAEQVMEQLGFKIEHYEATKENVMKYLTSSATTFISLTVDVNKLGTNYYQNFYDEIKFNDNAHAILCNGWVEKNGLLYLHILDSNIPVYHPAFIGTITPDDVWIKWEHIEPGLNLLYENGNWYMRGNNRAWFTVLSVTEKLLGDVDTTLTSSLVNTSFEPDLYSYRFSLSFVQKAIGEVMDFIRSSILDVDIMSSSTTLETSTKVTLDNIGLWWLRAISFAAMYYYQNNQEKTSDKIIEVHSTSDSMKYYKHFDRTVDSIHEYDWFTPCRVTDLAYTFGYICSTLLFNLGFAFSPYDFVTTDNYISLTKIGQTVTEKAGYTHNKKRLYYWIVDIDAVVDLVMISQRSRDSFQDTVFFTYAYSDELNNKATIKNSKYPIMLINTWQNNTASITYQNILGTGNSPNNRYDVTSAGAGNYNPYGNTTLANIKSWNEKVKEQLTDGDKGKALVISWFNEKDFEQ